MAVLDWLNLQRPQATAMSGSGGEVGYAAFARLVDTTADWLTAQGALPGQRIGVSLGSGPMRAWLNHLAVLRMGASCVSLGPAFAAQLEAIGGVDLVVARDADPGLTDFSGKVLRFNRDALAAAASGASRKSDGRSTPCGSRITTTSGTTGRPKGVLWDAETIARRVSATIDTLGISPDTTLFSLLGIDTAGGFRYPLATWQAGGSVLLAATRPEDAWAERALGRCNLLLASPASLRAWVRSGQPLRPGRAQRRVVCAGGRLAVGLRDQVLDVLAGRIDIAYGSTETGSIAMGDARIIDRHPGAVGYALPGVQIQIVDDEDTPVAAGLSGRVRVRSPNMVQGYWSAAGETASACFRDGWFLPGDIGCLEHDGLLVIHGRDGDTLNLGGSKIELGPLEQAIGELDAVSDCCALSVPGNDGDRLAVVVACADDTDLGALRHTIRAARPDLPQFTLVRLASIPRNAMGKVPRLALAQRIAQLGGLRGDVGA